MATFNYESSAATAKRLLTKFGQQVTLTEKASSGGPPGVPTSPADARTVEGMAVILDYRNTEIDGTVIQSGDAKLILEPDAGTPDNGMTSTINGKAWRVHDWAPLAPAGDVVLYKIQLRRV